MDRLFETRKRELVQECVIEEGLFAQSLARLEEFMKPFISELPRLKQRQYATTVVSGLCSDLQSKNAESIAYHFGMDRRPIRFIEGRLKYQRDSQTLADHRIVTGNSEGEIQVLDDVDTTE